MVRTALLDFPGDQADVVLGCAFDRKIERVQRARREYKEHAESVQSEYSKHREYGMRRSLTTNGNLLGTKKERPASSTKERTPRPKRNGKTAESRMTKMRGLVGIGCGMYSLRAIIVDRRATRESKDGVVCTGKLMVLLRDCKGAIEKQSRDVSVTCGLK